MLQPITYCMRHSGQPGKQHKATVRGLTSPQASNVPWWLEIARGEVPGIVVEAKPSDRVQFMVLDHYSDQADTQSNSKWLLHSW